MQLSDSQSAESYYLAMVGRPYFTILTELAKVRIKQIMIERSDSQIQDCWADDQQALVRDLVAAMRQGKLLSHTPAPANPTV